MQQHYKKTLLVSSGVEQIWPAPLFAKSGFLSLHLLAWLYKYSSERIGNIFHRPISHLKNLVKILAKDWKLLQLQIHYPKV